MSALVIRSFFPSIDTIVQHHPSVFQLWNLVFPPHIQKLCPRPQISFQVAKDLNLTLKWPFASIFCVLGIAIGFALARTVLGEALRSKNPRLGSFAWGMAFLWYGVMSVGGLFFHCVLTESEFFYLMDVIGTACCSVSIVAAMVQNLQVWKEERKWRGVLCVMYAVVVGGAVWGGQEIRELLYLVPSLLALVLGASYYVVRKIKGNGDGGFWLNCAMASSLIAVIPIVLDSKFCTLFGSNFGLLPWFFLGSDLALPFLYYATLAVNHHHPHTKNS